MKAAELFFVGDPNQKRLAAIAHNILNRFLPTPGRVTSGMLGLHLSNKPTSHRAIAIHHPEQLILEILTHLRGGVRMRTFIRYSSASRAG